MRRSAEAALAAGSLSACTVKMLRGYLRAAELPRSGLKEDLVARVKVRAGRVCAVARGGVWAWKGEEKERAGCGKN